MIILVSLTVIYSQGGMTGKWQGETRSGTKILLDVKATETALTGTLTVDGQPFAISDGKVSKNRFTFRAHEGITGEIAGGQIRLWLDRLGAPSTAVLHRVKLNPLTGKWRGKTKNGFEIVLELTAAEAELTGRFIRNGGTATIEHGKVSQNRFTFEATLNDRTEGFTGEIVGDQVKVWLDRQGPSMAAFLRRVEDERQDAGRML